MAKQFLYACAVVSSILLVSVSAPDPYKDNAFRMIENAADRVQQGFPAGVVKRDIDFAIQKLLSLSQTKIQLYKTAFINFIADSRSPANNIVALYAQHRLDSVEYPAFSTLDLISSEFHKIHPDSQQKWSVFIRTLEL
ncbi:uncharacterized protein LOC144425812 [Styela clava]